MRKTTYCIFENKDADRKNGQANKIFLCPQRILKINSCFKHSKPGRVGKLDLYFDKGIDFKQNRTKIYFFLPKWHCLFDFSCNIRGKQLKKCQNCQLSLSRFSWVGLPYGANQYSVLILSLVTENYERCRTQESNLLPNCTISASFKNGNKNDKQS